MILRTARLPDGLSVGDTIPLGGAEYTVISITFENRCVVLELEPLDPVVPPPPEPAP